jgi:two-component system NtrC family sensor kinase
MVATVLIVDDEPLICSALSRTLCNRFRVISAANSEQALRLLEADAEVPLAAIVDYNLPGRRGDELLRELRVRYPSVRRVLLSGAAPSHVQSLLAEGVAEAFYAKPWSPGELIAYLEKCQRT